MKRHGFTIIEIMVVVTIIALLIALVIPILSQVGERARTATTKSLIADLSRATEAFNAVFGYYPHDYLDNFSYVSSESGTQKEQEKAKSSAVLLLALTHSFIDNPTLASQSPSRGRGPFYDTLRVGENVRQYTATNYPTMTADPKNPLAFSMLTPATLGLPPSSTRPAFVLIDPWGNALVYDEKKANRLYTDGKATQGNSYERTDYVAIDLGDSGGCCSHAVNLPYIIYSFGPNGIDDTDGASTSGEQAHGDDIGNW